MPASLSSTPLSASLLTSVFSGSTAPGVAPDRKPNADREELPLKVLLAGADGELGFEPKAGAGVPAMEVPAIEMSEPAENGLKSESTLRGGEDGLAGDVRGGDSGDGLGGTGGR